MQYEYEKQLEGDELVIYKYSKAGDLIEYAKIHLDCEYPGWLQVDYYGTDGFYMESSHAHYEDFGVNDFEELVELPVQLLARVIWGDC